MFFIIFLIDVLVHIADIKLIEEWIISMGKIVC